MNSLPIILFYLVAAFLGFWVLPRFLDLKRFEKLLAVLEKGEIGIRDKVIAPTSAFFAALKVTPNAITFLGLGLTVLLGFLFASGAPTYWLIVVGSLAALTDMFDGSLARLTKKVTSLGGAMDGVRDFLLFAVLTAGLISKGLLSFELFLWFGIGSLAILALKTVEVFVSPRAARLSAAFKRRFVGEGKMEIDRFKVFFYFSGLLLLLLGASPSFFVLLGNIFVTVSIAAVTTSVLMHSALIRFRLFSAESRKALTRVKSAAVVD